MFISSTCMLKVVLFPRKCFEFHWIFPDLILAVFLTGFGVVCVSFTLMRVLDCGHLYSSGMILIDSCCLIDIFML